MSRLGELIERELVVANCLASSLCAIRLGIYAKDRKNGGLAELPEVWLGRAESSLLFAQAELAYLFGPAPPPTTERVL